MLLRDPSDPTNNSTSKILVKLLLQQRLIGFMDTYMELSN